MSNNQLTKSSYKVVNEIESLGALLFYEILNFPKHENNGLVVQIKNTYYNILKKVIYALKYRRTTFYTNADAELAYLRHLIRESYNKYYINDKKFERITGKMSQIGGIFNRILAS